MNFWTGLIAGLIIGWLIEWIIDYFFYRQGSEEAAAAQQAIEQRVADSEADLGAIEEEWQARQALAEQDYEAGLAAVEREWQARLNENEQTWLAQFAALEAANAALQARIDDTTLADEEDVDLWRTEQVSIDTGDLSTLDDIDLDTADRLRLAGIYTYEDLAEADPSTLAVAMGVDSDTTRGWIDSARLALVGLAAGAATLAARDDVHDEVSDDILLEELVIADALITDDEGHDDEVLIVDDVLVHEVEVPDKGLGIPAAVVATAALAAVDDERERRDDLTRIYGIGPKYAGKLNEAGIYSFADLAAADPDHLREIIQPADWQQIDFESWPAQAAAFLAVRPAEQEGDDLTRLEGIGPTYAQRLRENGITTFAALADADEQSIATIIDAPAWRQANYGDWIAQARLLAWGDEEGLKALQDELFSRSEVDNLQLIKGMGQKSADALTAGGITTFAALAAAHPDELDGLMKAAGLRRADYDAWIEEAGTRAAGHRVTRTQAVSTYVVTCPQDLSAVEGIGTVYEQKLYEAGIGSYWELAEATNADLTTILEIREFQDVDLAEIKASAMQLAVQTNSLGRGWDGTPPDDFDVFEGLGETYERRLYEAGICTYEALAALTLARLAEICRAPEWNKPDYAAWIDRATALRDERRSS